MQKYFVFGGDGHGMVAARVIIFYSFISFPNFIILSKV